MTIVTNAESAWVLIVFIICTSCVIGMCLDLISELNEKERL